MFDDLDKYQNRGSFSFREGDKLRTVSKNVPNLPGVYYFEQVIEKQKNIIYIGASGTIETIGEFKKQLLKKRLNNKQDRMLRQVFFDNKLRQENISEINVHWFVTFDEKTKDLPGFVEGLLFQKFFEIHGRLPEWNKNFPT